MTAEQNHPRQLSIELQDWLSEWTSLRTEVDHRREAIFKQMYEGVPDRLRLQH